MNLLLSGPNVGSIILLALLFIVLLASPFIMRAKNKRELDNAQKMLDALKKGDSVLTAAGIIGKIVSFGESKYGYKTVTIETGDEKHKGYMTLDVNGIYANLSNPVVPQSTTENKEENTTETNQTEEQSTEVETVTKEEKVEEKVEEVVEE